MLYVFYGEQSVGKEFIVKRDIVVKVEIREQWKYGERKYKERESLYLRGGKMRIWEEGRERIIRDKKGEDQKYIGGRRGEIVTNTEMYIFSCYKIDLCLCFRLFGKNLMLIKLNLGKRKNF